MNNCYKIKGIKELIQRFIKKLDRFGEKFTFKYKDEEKYSTIYGGIIFILLMSFSIFIIIKNSIPFFKKENITLQFYTVKLNQTEDIKLNESSFSFGLDCDIDNINKISGKDLFDLKLSFTEKSKDYSISHKREISTELFNQSKFYIENNETFGHLKTTDFKMIKPNETEKNKLIGIWTDKTFSYFSITVVAKNKSKEHFNKIYKYLLNNECRLQVYYTDITVNISNYKEPIKNFIDSLFLQINPHLLIKKNIFFMNYHFKNDTKLISILDNNNNEEIKIGFSRTENYFIYKGIDRVNTTPDYDEYAKLYIRVDNKKLEIKKKYQNLLEFYADNSSLWIGLFGILNWIISIIYDYKSNRLISKKLFYFEEEENNKIIFLQNKNKDIINVNQSSIYNIKVEEDNLFDKNENKKIYNRKNIETSKNIRNNIQKGKDLNTEESNKEEFKNSVGPFKKIEEKYKNPITTFEFFKFSIYSCCKKRKELQFREKLIKQSLNIIDNKLDIYIYIKNMILLDLMYEILIDDNKKDYINFLSRTMIYLDIKRDEEEEEENEKKLNDIYKPVSKLYQRLYNNFKNLTENSKKTEIEEKIVSLFNGNKNP